MSIKGVKMSIKGVKMSTKGVKKVVKKKLKSNFTMNVNTQNNKQRLTH